MLQLLAAQLSTGIIAPHQRDYLGGHHERQRRFELSYLTPAVMERFDKALDELSDMLATVQWGTKGDGLPRRQATASGIPIIADRFTIEGVAERMSDAKVAAAQLRGKTIRPRHRKPPAATSPAVITTWFRSTKGPLAFHCNVEQNVRLLPWAHFRVRYLTDRMYRRRVPKTGSSQYALPPKEMPFKTWARAWARQLSLYATPSWMPCCITTSISCTLC